MGTPLWQPVAIQIFSYVQLKDANMAKEDWGVKRLCPTSGKRFYDMNRNPIISPYTGEVVEIEANRKSSVVSSRAKDKVAEVVENDEDDVVLDDDDDAANVEIDDSLLDDDEDDDGDTVALDDIADVASDDDDS